MSMKISIVGPGALGCLFAVRLHESGNAVTIVDYRDDRAERLRNAGVTVQDGAGAHNAKRFRRNRIWRSFCAKLTEPNR